MKLVICKLEDQNAVAVEPDDDWVQFGDRVAVFGSGSRWKNTRARMREVGRLERDIAGDVDRDYSLVLEILRMNTAFLATEVGMA